DPTGARDRHAWKDHLRGGLKTAYDQERRPNCGPRPWAYRGARHARYAPRARRPLCAAIRLAVARARRVRGANAARRQTDLSGESGMSVDSFVIQRRAIMRRNLLAHMDEDEVGRFDMHLVRGFGPYVAPYRLAAMASAVLMLLYTGANLANPYLIGLAIDNYIQHGDLRGLGIISVVLLVVNVVQWQAQYWQVWTMSWA